MGRLRDRITEQYSGKQPVVLDIFSGRGIIPLEAARVGATAIGSDLSPVATLAGRLLAEYPLRDWSAEPALSYVADSQACDEDGNANGLAGQMTERWSGKAVDAPFEGLESEPRLLHDVRAVLAEVGRRVAAQVAPVYPGNPTRGGAVPWAYLWAVTIPCDGCGRHFPLIGLMVLRHPYTRTADDGQSLRLRFEGDAWNAQVHSGEPTQEPTFAAAAGKRGKSARCPFPTCGYTHTLDVIKAKGNARQYDDAMLAVAEVDPITNQKIFRRPRPDEITAAASANPATLPLIDGLRAVPDEAIPETAGVDARQYGFTTYGSLMNTRQAFLFATTARVINDLHEELVGIVSTEYAQALSAYAAANLPRQVRRATRGANLLSHGNAKGTAQNRCQVGDVFSSQSVIKHQFDYLEAGPAVGPGTWSSVSTGLVNALKKSMGENANTARAGRFRRGSAVALPFRDGTVDVLVTDPPYYQMVAYADSSDVFYVWLKRALHSGMADLFDGNVDGPDGLQDKAEEIIVKGRGAKGHGDHRTEEFYESMLARSFSEARRVLKADGHLTVIFGHSDPDAWKRLLAALTEAGFVVTSSWPSRTETAVTGVATINVTVSIGCQVAPANRSVGIAAQVDAEVVADVKSRCRGWDSDGLALQDQLMASYGAALQIVGRYQRVLTPNGETVDLEHYMTLARRSVRDAVALRLNEMPLETFDPATRMAVFWHELYGRSDVPKGEARFFAQSDGLRLEDMRGPILVETKAGFQLRHDPPESVMPSSSTYEVVRAMAGAWSSGSAAVGAVLATAEVLSTDAHLWAVVDWVAAKLPASDPVAISLAAVKRNTSAIQSAAGSALAQSTTEQLTLGVETA
jgi:putative DNA methylase